MDDSTKYFYARGEKQFGPHSIVEIESKITSGEIKPDTKIWTKGMTEWLPAKSVHRVSAVFEEIPPPIKSSPLSKEQVKNLNASSFIPIVSSFVLGALAIKGWRDGSITYTDIDILFTSILYPFLAVGGVYWMSTNKNHELKFPVFSSALFCVVAVITSTIIGIVISSIIIS